MGKRRRHSVRGRAQRRPSKTRTATLSKVNNQSFLENRILLRFQDSNLDLTAPKAVVLPLHQSGLHMST